MKKLNKIILIVAAIFAVSFATACNSSQTKHATGESMSLADSTQPDATNGQIMIDVRTVEEWNGDGHANCSVNIPLDELSSKVEELKKYHSITLVCRSGNRANKAKAMLEEAGLKNITNLGAWQNIQCK